MLAQYIKRCYLFNKAVKKSYLSAFQIYVLYTVSLYDGCIWFVIFKQLHKVNRKPNESFLGNQIKLLVSKEYLRKDEHNKYYLTPAGLSALKDFEHRLRIERHDR